MVLHALGRCRRGSKTGNLGAFRYFQCLKASLEASATGCVEDGAVSVNDVVKTHVANSRKTVDKSGLDLSKLKRMAMDKPLPGVPPLKPAEEFETPITKVTTLENGLRIASQETYGPLCTIGLVIECGSRDETDLNTGVSHLAELMAFQSTHRLTVEQLVSEVERVGGEVNCHSSREQLLYCIDVLRDSMENAMRLLADSILAPSLSNKEVEEQKHVMALQVAEMPSDMLLKEILQEAAYKGTPLGRPHYCPSGKASNLSAETLREFRANTFTAPRIVLAGAGVCHEEFVELGNNFFSSLPSKSAQPLKRAPALYTGGVKTMPPLQPHEELTRVALAYEVGGWHDDRFVPTCVLQVLLGGGDSFSAGGPGKGMHSRLYREVLNRYFWAEAAEAFTLLHSDTGLLGISGAVADPSKAGELLSIFCQHFVKLATQPVTQVELLRAKNMLKCNVLTQLESRMVLFEDIGRQILSYGYHESAEEICPRIDAVTAEDIMQLVQPTLEANSPSVSSVGSDLSAIPSIDVIKEFTKGILAQHS